jgi:CheY-like chemotaxis protein
LSVGQRLNAFCRQSDKEVSKDSAPEQIPNLFKPPHILFIDDMEQLARLGKLFLENDGFQVTIQTDPLEALLLFKENKDHFQLVIADLAMPGMNGLELARQIYAHAPDMPIVLSTGHGNNFTVDELKSVGIRTVISKPFTPSELSRTIRQVI